jgi:hypothetical protein
VPARIRFSAAGQGRACGTEGGRRRVISAVGWICRDGVCGPADLSCHAAAGNAAVAHLPAMRWWEIVECRQVEVSPAYHPAFGRLYLLVQSVRAAPRYLPGWSGCGGQRPHLCRKWIEVAAGKASPEIFLKKNLRATPYDTVQASLFLRPCRHPPPGSPPGGRFLGEAYARAQPRMLLPIWPLRVRGGCG